MRLPWPRLLTDERGLTLAEILVALLVIGVGLSETAALIHQDEDMPDVARAPGAGCRGDGGSRECHGGRVGCG